MRTVEHKASRQFRCLKAISKRLIPRKQLSRIYYEIELHRALDHPNIVKMYEWFEDEEKIFIIMELCSGGNLQERIVANKNVRFDENSIASLMQQVLSAVNYLHKNGVVH